MISFISNINPKSEYVKHSGLCFNLGSSRCIRRVRKNWTKGVSCKYWYCHQWLLWRVLWSCSYVSQKQPSRGALRKRCSENMQQIYRRAPIPKCDFNKVAKHLYWNRKATLLKSHFGIAVFLYVCYICLEHLFIRTPQEECLWVFFEVNHTVAFCRLAFQKTLTKFPKQGCWSVFAGKIQVWVSLSYL